jgi:hypothetical protein
MAIQSLANALIIRRRRLRFSLTLILAGLAACDAAKDGVVPTCPFPANAPYAFAKGVKRKQIEELAGPGFVQRPAAEHRRERLPADQPRAGEPSSLIQPRSSRRVCAYAGPSACV